MKLKSASGAPVNSPLARILPGRAGRREHRCATASLARPSGKRRRRRAAGECRPSADGSSRAPARDVELAGNILSRVPGRFHLDAPEILSRNPSLRVAEARKLAMFLVVELTGLPYQQIGRLFHRDHSTIFHAHNRLRARMAAQPWYRRHVEALLASFGRGAKKRGRQRRH